MHQDMYVLKFMKQDWQVNHLWQICQLDLAVIWDIRSKSKKTTKVILTEDKPKEE